MPELKNILVTTDFSPASLVAVHYAAAWAKASGAALYIANFVRPIELGMAAGIGSGVNIDLLMASAHRGLEAIAAGPLLHGITFSTLVREAEVGDGLLALTSELHLDLVVSASAGRRGLGKLLIGSTAEVIFRRSLCPVLLLGPGIEHAAIPPVRRILFATDFGPAAPAAAVYAARLARDWSASLRLLHVLPPPASESGLHAVADSEARLRQLAPASAAVISVEAAFGSPAETIVAQAAAEHSDLILLGARPLPPASLFSGWATAYQVLCTAHCPVLTVHGAA
ncbi:MAG: universal stress protein [Terriglobales bacterium]